MFYLLPNKVIPICLSGSNFPLVKEVCMLHKKLTRSKYNCLTFLDFFLARSVPSRRFRSASLAAVVILNIEFV